MYKYLVLGFVLFLSILVNGQDTNSINTQKIWRVNFLNPAIELELPTAEKTTFSLALGIGYSGGYPDLTFGGSGFVYIIAPFLDLQHKWFYNFEKRKQKQKTVEGNSGNFWSIRFITTGPSVAENVTRTSDFDFAIGPTWGIQRRYSKKFHLLFDIGPQYYFDTEGNGNFWPIMIQLDLGFDF
ncbi:MAG: hypothetical protein WBN55_03180 [Eudoraea sp.]|uniref:hypothetical protein n=2 Tax=Eudoraea sp. TaxID=1979955 RepID=UPI003C72DB34